MLIYTVIVSIQVISFFLIFKTISNYSFALWEWVVYPLSMLLFTWLFGNEFGVWGAFFFVSLFILIGVIKEKGFEFISIFYGFYALLMNSFLGYIVAGPLEYLFSLAPFLPQEFLYLCVALVPPMANWIILNGLEHWFPEYSLRNLKSTQNIPMVALILILLAVTGLLYWILTIENQTDAVSWKNNLIILSLFLVVIFSLLLLNIHYQRRRKKELQSIKDEQLIQLQEYTKHVEALYEEINHFKHDYINILTSLEDSVKNQDINRVQDIYESVIKPTKQTFQTNDFMIARLSNILIPEIKSIISAKLLIARQKKIDIQVEVIEPIESIDTDLLNLIRIISILLDNAIEAASLMEESWLRIAILEEKNTVIIIENSSNERVDIRKINEKGYSSKGLGRGIGLYTVQKILKDNQNLFLETSSDHQMFSQVLKIAREIV